MKFTTAATTSQAIIDGVEISNDTLTGRGGLSLFVPYLRNVQSFQQMDTFFGSMRCTCKGQPITEIFKQLLYFFVDGTSRHPVYFDELAKDGCCSAAIESEPHRMVSSHAVKRVLLLFLVAAYLPVSAPFAAAVFVAS